MYIDTLESSISKHCHERQASSKRGAFHQPGHKYEISPVIKSEIFFLTDSFKRSPQVF